MFEVSLPSLVVIVFGAIAFIELLYYYLIYARFSFAKKKAQKYLYQPPVSIVMVAKDAAGVLLKTLPKFLNQQYGEFEVVVVDDNSQDDTKLLVVEYQQQYSNLKLVELDTAVTTIRGEKFALSMVSAALRIRISSLPTPNMLPRPPIGWRKWPVTLKTTGRLCWDIAPLRRKIPRSTACCILTTC